LGLLTAGVGGTLGAALAYYLMAYTDAILYHDVVLSVLPGAIIMGIAAILLIAFKDISQILAKRTFDTELDTSQMEGRCLKLASRCDLTGRECEVLLLLGQGRNIPGIADALCISPSTAKSHMLHIYRKADVASRQELLDLLYGIDQ
jgi:DNA-binding CsgD family transcriptional regulator